MIVCIYVDDFIYTGNNENMLREFSVAMKSEFEMTDLGLKNYFLGIEVTQNSDGTFISQEKYANDIFKRFGMQNSKAAITPIAMGVKLSKEDESKKVDSTLYKSLVGSLMYCNKARYHVCSKLDK
eukprot:Gb_00723 [translate_table: standard]